MVGLSTMGRKSILTGMKKARLISREEAKVAAKYSRGATLVLHHAPWRSGHDGATLDDLREAVTTLEETTRTARRAR